jgi:hypothetical protein
MTRGRIKITWLMVLLFLAGLTVNGIELLSHPTSPTDPASIALALLVLGTAVIVAAGIALQWRFYARAAAVSGSDRRVVIAPTRTPVLLLALGVLLLEPDILIGATHESDWDLWGIVAAFGLASVALILSQIKQLPPTIIDESGIESAGVWRGRIQWRDLTEIRMEKIERRRLECLVFAFRDPAQVPDRIRRNRILGDRKAQGEFTVLAQTLGLLPDDAQSGLTSRLERFRKPGARVP